MGDAQTDPGFSPSGATCCGTNAVVSLARCYWLAPLRAKRSARRSLGQRGSEGPAKAALIGTAKRCARVGVCNVHPGPTPVLALRGLEALILSGKGKTSPLNSHFNSLWVVNPVQALQIPFTPCPAPPARSWGLLRGACVRCDRLGYHSGGRGRRWQFSTRDGALPAKASTGAAWEYRDTPTSACACKLTAGIVSRKVPWKCGFH